MSQGIDSEQSEGFDAPRAKRVVSWEEISPETLRQSALSEEAEVVGVDDELGAIGMAWFEIILGGLLGITAMVGAWYWTDGALGPVVAVPPVLIGLPLFLTKRRDLRYLGYGLLASVPVALVLVMLIWYLMIFF